MKENEQQQKMWSTKTKVIETHTQNNWTSEQSETLWWAGALHCIAFVFVPMATNKPNRIVFMNKSNFRNDL